MSSPSGVLGLIVNGSGTAANAQLDANSNFQYRNYVAAGNPDVLIANYGGDANSQPSQSAPVNEVVNPDPQPQPTKTVITGVTPNPAIVGQACHHHRKRQLFVSNRGRGDSPPLLRSNAHYEAPSRHVYRFRNSSHRASPPHFIVLAISQHILHHDFTVYSSMHRWRVGNEVLIRAPLHYPDSRPSGRNGTARLRWSSGSHWPCWFCRRDGATGSGWSERE